MTDEKPDGPLSGVLFEYAQRLDAAQQHAIAEGHSPDGIVVLNSYARVEHPVTYRLRQRAEVAGSTATAFAAWSLISHVEALLFVVLGGIVGADVLVPAVVFSVIGIVSMGLAAHFDEAGGGA